MQGTPCIQSQPAQGQCKDFAVRLGRAGLGRIGDAIDPVPQAQAFTDGQQTGVEVRDDRQAQTAPPQFPKHSGDFREELPGFGACEQGVHRVEKGVEVEGPEILHHPLHQLSPPAPILGLVVGEIAGAVAGARHRRKLCPEALLDALREIGAG